MAIMVNEYTEQLRQEMDWAGLKAELEGMKDNSDYIREDESGIKAVEVFIGTVFALTPSGKYYVPWASSNVTDEEAEKDAAWYEALEELCSEHGLYLTSGEGDPCDLFIGMTCES